jgi:hypothetical protein
VRRILTKIERLNGSHPGLATDARILLDQGLSAKKVAEVLNEKYLVRISRSAVGKFRTDRWGPELDLLREKVLTAKAFVEQLGEDKGLDALLLAKLFELMGTLKTVEEVVALRQHVLKARDQDLKEKEFLFKTGQLKPGVASQGGEGDAAAEGAKRKRVMNQIREIFGLPPLPEEESSQEPGVGPTPGEGLRPAGRSETSQAEIESSGDRASEASEKPASPDEPVGAVAESV